ncbi:MAG: nucleoside deaminase [Clostridiaceae bacterium]|jgi:tRNA(adenine34) deaminase|nr:nucleoside deaminase [Clostridiaceae bacterium]
MWEKVSEPWKIAFSQGWESFKKGSIPIGAVITDEIGNIISVGRNRMYESGTLNPRIAHAETVCLQNLDISKYPNVKQYTLYTAMEPCPMCFGTIVMSNFRKIKVAARDSYCGAVYLSEQDPYIKSKNMQIEFESGLLQDIQIVLQAYFELRACNGEVNKIVDIFCRDCPEAVQIAKAFYEEKYLDFCVQSNKEFKDVFESIVLMHIKARHHA